MKRLEHLSERIPFALERQQSLSKTKKGTTMNLQLSSKKY